MKLKLLKVVMVGLILCGLVISAGNLVVPKSYAAEWVFGTIHLNYCIPADPCWIMSGWCCYDDASNCTYDP